MASIIWTQNALNDINNIAEFISRDSEFYAKQFVKKLMNAAIKLENYPEIGRPLQGFTAISLQGNSFQKI